MKKAYIVLSFFTLFLSTTLYGNTIYVPDDYSTIQEAINTAENGDTVIVRDGIFHENLIVNKGITLKSENGPENCIIDGGNSGSVIVINIDGVVIEGFTIRNSGNNWSDAGINVNSHSNKIRDNCIINSSNGIYLQDSTNNTIIGNNIRKNEKGIYFSDSTNNVIVGNNIEENDRGIDFGYSSDNYIIGNVIKENDNIGIYLIFSDNNLITGNIIKENGRGILLSDSSYNSIINNTFIRDGISIGGEVLNYWIHTIENNTVNGKPLYYIRDKVGGSIKEDAGQVILISCSNITIEKLNTSNTDEGITVVDSSNITVRNCEISNNSGSGIYLWGSSDCIITGNSIRGNGNGIYFIASSDNVIKGNSIRENGVGIYFEYSSSINKIIGNNITENDEGIYFIDSLGNVIVGNNISKNNNEGIYLTLGSSISVINVIMGNDIGENDKGISLKFSVINIITGNNIRENRVGICLWNSSANIIYFNNFVSNKYENIRPHNPINLWDLFLLPLKITVPYPIRVIPLLCLLYITPSTVSLTSF